MPVNLRTTAGFSGLLVTPFLGLALLTTTAAGQLGRPCTPDPGVEKMMVVPFAGDTGLRAMLQDSLSVRLARDFGCKRSWIVAPGDIRNSLTQSGYKPNEPLAPSDAKSLAQQMRVGVYIQGTISKTARGIQIAAQMVRYPDTKLIQPLPPVAANRLGLAVVSLSAGIKAARAQDSAELHCEQYIRDKKYASAIPAAKAAIVAYPQATIARVCLITAYEETKVAPDTILSVVEEILKLHPTDEWALQIGVRAHEAAGNDSAAIAMLTKLLAANPTDTKIQQAYITKLAATNNKEAALKAADEAIQLLAGDPGILELKYVLHLGLKQWPEAIAAGEELVRADTSKADTTFFQRQAAAFKFDSQPLKAAQYLARGILKFPNNIRLRQLRTQYLQEAGQLQESIVSARGVLGLNPDDITTYLQIGKTFIDLGQPDSALATMRIAIAHAKTAADTSNVANTVLQPALDVVQEIKGDTSASRQAKGEHVLPYFTFVDSIGNTDEIHNFAKFFQGLTYYFISAALINGAFESKNCEAIKHVQELQNTAQSLVNKGGKANPPVAQSVLLNLMDVGPKLDQAAKVFCKPPPEGPWPR